MGGWRMDCKIDQSIVVVVVDDLILVNRAGKEIWQIFCSHFTCYIYQSNVLKVSVASIRIPVGTRI